MVILSGSEKGGSGKSTIATIIAGMAAARGRDVALLDADPQGTAATWCAARRSQDVPPVPVSRATGNLSAAVQRLTAAHALVVIDAGGRDSIELRSGLVSADVLLLPIEPSSADAWVLPAMANLVEEARRHGGPADVVTVISKGYADPRIPENDDLRALLRSIDALPAPAAMLCARVDYKRALGLGLTPEELPASPKAIDEAQQLYDALQRFDALP